MIYKTPARMSDFREVHACPFSCLGAYKRKGLRVWWVGPLLALVLFGCFTAMAQQGPPLPANVQDSGITRQQADEILKELREIRQLLERQSRAAMLGRLPQMPEVPQTGKLRIEGAYSLGAAEAPLTIVGFTDYQCPHCRQFENTTFVEIRKKYIDTGKVRFIIRNFPLVDIHPNALQAAEAAHCAGDQGKFWPMHDALVSDPGKLGRSGLIDAAASLKLDMSAFQSCLDGGKHKSEIQNDIRMASSLQINGTPSFLVGKTNGQEVSGAIIVGAQPLSVFEAKLKAAEVAK